MPSTHRRPGDLPKQEPGKPAHLVSETDHEANPMAFLGLCSLISSMSFLQNRDEGPTPTHTPCLMRFLVHKSIQENKGPVVVCEAGRLQMQR